jgi:hypothetical protein
VLFPRTTPVALIEIKAMRAAHGPGAKCGYVDLRNLPAAGARLGNAMTAYLFRCPATGYSVQGLVANPVPEGDIYQTVTCAACSRTHLVNPKTGKVAGAERK